MHLYGKDREGDQDGDDELKEAAGLDEDRKADQEELLGELTKKGGRYHDESFFVR